MDMLQHSNAELKLASMVDCSVQEDRLQWRYVDGLTQVKSALAGGQEWCLDGGEANEVYQTVTVNKVSEDLYCATVWGFMWSS